MVAGVVMAASGSLGKGQHSRVLRQSRAFELGLQAWRGPSQGVAGGSWVLGRDEQHVTRHTCAMFWLARDHAPV